ncbi:MAG: right-handed parallel beta-helix repeat-containing protein [Gammaproteobacteria bacterium]|nr:right-handed parallel beta-helix repeat-containing protein [Gammaproteobacteria bacterium]
MKARIILYNLIITLLIPNIVHADVAVIYENSECKENLESCFISKYENIVEAIHSVKKAKLNRDTKVKFSFDNGDYYFDQTLSISASGFPEKVKEINLIGDGDNVRFIGGVAFGINESNVNNTYANNYTYDLGYLNKLDEKLYWGRGDYSFEELIINKRPYQLARWPNHGYLRTGDVISIGSIPREARISPNLPVFKFNSKRIRNWAGESDIWVRGYFKWDWFDEPLKIKSINFNKHAITLDSPHYYGLHENRRFYFSNIRSELDVAGEFYIERKRKLLKFIFKGDNKNYDAILTLLKSPLIKLSNVENVLVENITFIGGRGIGIKVEGGVNNTIKDCEFIGSGVSAIHIDGGIKHNLLNNIISYIGASPIVINAGDRQSLESSKHLVKGNIIEHYGRHIATKQAGIKLYGVGVTVEENLIRNAPHMGIYFEGNEHKIENNIIHDVCLDTGDAGAIYAGRDWSYRGNLIKRNLFFNISKSKGLDDVNAVYLDDMLSGTTIVENIFYNVYRGVLIGGGRDNSVIDNLFVETHIPIHADDRALNWASNSIEKGNVMFKKLNTVPFQSDVWVDSYPGISSIINSDPGVPLNNKVYNNNFINSGKNNIAESVKDNGIYKDNISFVDLEGLSSKQIKKILYHCSVKDACNFKDILDYIY